MNIDFSELNVYICMYVDCMYYIILFKIYAVYLANVEKNKQNKLIA